MRLWTLWCIDTIKDTWTKSRERVEVGEGGGFSWGGGEGWGEKAYNCNWITIKIKKKTGQRIWPGISTNKCIYVKKCIKRCCKLKKNHFQPFNKISMYYILMVAIFSNWIQLHSLVSKLNKNVVYSTYTTAV